MIKAWEKFELFLIKIIEKLENRKISLTGWLVSFIAVALLRNILDVFSVKMEHFFQWEYYFFHSIAGFFACIFTLILFAYFLTKEKIEKITRIALFGVFFILLPPILDLIFTQGAGASIHYREILADTSFFDFFKLFWGWIVVGPGGIFFSGGSDFPLSHLEYNFGTRIEGLLIALVFLWYIFLKTKNILKVILGLFLIYLFTFVLAIFPFILSSILKIAPQSISLEGIPVLNSFFGYQLTVFSLYFILTFIFAGLWFFIYNKQKFLAISKNLRPYRAFHNLAMLGFGIYLCKIPFQGFNFFDWLLITMASLSLLLYWLSGTGYDDLYDETIDKVSNPSRPLPQSKFFKDEFRSINNVLRAASYFSAFIVGYGFFLMLVLRSLIAHIYSAPPFRLKRFPIIATFLLALAAISTILGGYLVNASNSIYDFPGELLLFILIAFTLGFMVKDIKDYEGDKKGGIYTIPVIFGQKQGKKILGFLTLFVFLLSPFFFFLHFNSLILPSLFAGILSFWLLNKKEYREKPLFLIYFSYGLFFALTMF